MTKKIISILLSVLMIFSMLPTGVFAEGNVELNLGTALVDGTDIKVPVILSELPSDFEALSSLDMEYEYDKSVIKYSGVESAAIQLGEEHSDDGAVSWYSSDSSFASANDTVMFYLLFEALTDAPARVAVSFAELGTNVGGHRVFVPSTNEIVVNATPAVVGFGEPTISDITVRVPVMLDKIPDDIKDIASFDMDYIYDAGKLAYVGIEAGALPVNSDTSAEYAISWYNSTTPVTDVTDALFTLVFNIKDGAAGEASVSVTGVEIADSDRNISKTVKAGEGAIVEIPSQVVEPMITFGPATMVDSVISVPVSLSKIPDSFDDLASFYMEYTYNEDLVTYTGIEAGAIPVDGETSTAGTVSWYNSITPVTDVTDALFTLKFAVKANVQGTATFTPVEAELADADRNIVDVEKFGKTSIDVDTYEPPVEAEVKAVTTNAAELEIPVNTADVEQWIKDNLVVSVEYTDGTKVDNATGYAVTVADGKILVSFEGVEAAPADVIYTKATITAGSAEVTGADRLFEIPVTMDGIPADINNIASATISYTYDDAIKYVETKPGVLDVTEAQVTDGKVSWYNSTAPVESIDNSVLFTLVFKAPCDAETEFAFVIDVEEITSSTKVTDNVNGVNGAVKVVAVEHNWSEWATTTPATLDADGVQTRTCNNCGATETRPVTLTDIELNIGELEIPYDEQDDVAAYIKSQIVAKAKFSDNTELEIPADAITVTVDGENAKVAYKTFEKNVAIELEPAPIVDPMVTFGPATAEGTVISVPVKLNKIPDTLANLASFYMEYTYSEDLVTYTGIEAGAIPVDGETSTAGTVSWYNSITPVTDVTDALFTLKFAVKANVQGTATFTPAEAELADADRNIVDVEKFGKTSIDVDTYEPPVEAEVKAVTTNAAELEIPVNTADVEQWIKDNLVVSVEYTDGTKVDNATGYAVTVADGKILVSFEGVEAAPADVIYTKATITAGSAEVTGADRLFEIPVTMDGIPADINNIASATISYTYDAAIKYVETKPGVLDVTEDQVTDGRVSWYNSTAPVESIDNSVLFTLVFKAPCDAETEFDFVIDVEEISSSTKVTDNVNGVNGAVKVVAVAHNWSEWATTTPATLDADGVQTRTCNNCGATETRPVTLTDIELNIGELEIPYDEQDDVAAYIKSQIVAKAKFSDNTELEIPADAITVTVDGENAKVAYKTFEKNVAIELEPAPIVDPMVTFGPATAEGTVISVPVKLNKIPDTLANLASFYMEYTYSEDLVTYTGIEAGAIPVDGETSTAGTVSWYNSITPVTDVTDVLFTLKFEVKDGVSGTATFTPAEAEVADANRNVVDIVEFRGASIEVEGGEIPPVVLEGIRTDVADITLPVNTADIEAYIRANIIVYADYSDGSFDEIHNYDLEITDDAVVVSYEGFEAENVALAYDKATITAGSAEVTGADRLFEIPVTMDGIPADINNIASATISYIYDAAIKYVETKPGVLDVTEDQVTDGRVSWYNSTAPVESIDNSVLFTLVFKAPCDVETEFDFVIDVEEISSDDEITTNIVSANGVVSIVAVEHNWSDWSTVVEPSLEAPGQEMRECSNCGEVETRDIVMTGLVLSANTLDVPFRQQAEDKKIPYIRSQILVYAHFSDGTKLVVENADFADQGETVKITFNGFEKELALNLEEAPDKDEIYFDIPVIEENREIKVPVVISALPDTITDASVIEINYTYDDSLLEYVGTHAPEGGETDGSTAGKVVISVDVDEINHTAVAVVTFKAPCQASGSVTIDITDVFFDGVDVSDQFNCDDIIVNIVPQDCVFGPWENHPDTDPKDYKNGMQIRYCVNCGVEFETRKLEVSYIEHAQTKIVVPYKEHNNKTEAQIASYLAANAGTLATATLANGEKVNIANADINVTVDSDVPKAIITYEGAYNEATAQYYDAVCEIALEYKPKAGGTSSGGASKPGNQGGSGNIVIVPSQPDANKPLFNDLPETHFAYEAIKDLVDRGIVSGDGNGNVSPDTGITREETAKIALLINGIAVESGLPIDYSDKADVSEWAYDYVATAIKHGVLKGYTDGTMRPKDIVSREELVAIVIRALNVQINGNAETKFSDVSAEKWSSGYIAAASDLGVVNGYTDGTFRPDNDITRAEAFTIYYRVIQFKEKLAAAIQ